MNVEWLIGDRSMRTLDYFSRYTDEFGGQFKESILIVALAEFFAKRKVFPVTDDSLATLVDDYKNGYATVIADGKVLCQIKEMAP